MGCDCSFVIPALATRTLIGPNCSAALAMQSEMLCSSDISPAMLNKFAGGSVADLAGRRSWAVTLHPAAVQFLVSSRNPLLFQFWGTTKQLFHNRLANASLSTGHKGMTPLNGEERHRFVCFLVDRMIGSCFFLDVLKVHSEKSLLPAGRQLRKVETLVPLCVHLDRSKLPVCCCEISRLRWLSHVVFLR